MKLTDLNKEYDTMEVKDCFHIVFATESGEFMHSVAMENRPGEEDIERIYDVLLNDSEIGVPEEVLREWRVAVLDPNENPDEVKEFEEFLASLDIDDHGYVQLPNKASD
jgi:hypothetical protein